MPTIYEVAESAGVSPKTAARILAGGSPRSKLRAKVLRSAEHLGYVRNQQAANLRTGRSQLVGVMVPFIDNPFYTKFLQEVHDSLARRHYHSLVTCSFGNPTDMLAAITLFEKYNVDAVAVDVSEGIVTPEITARLAQLQARGRTVVITGGQRRDSGFDHLHLDNRSAISKVVRHLGARGYRDLALLGGLAENLTIVNRLEGFKAALRTEGLRFERSWVSLGAPALGNVVQRAHELLRRTPRPNGIVCTSDMIAMVAMKAAAEIGLHVPRDIAITGFDDIDQAALLIPSLTTVRQPLRVMAEDLAELLLNPRPARAAVREKRYEAELVIREST